MRGGSKIFFSVFNYCGMLCKVRDLTEIGRYITYSTCVTSNSKVGSLKIGSLKAEREMQNMVRVYII